MARTEVRGGQILDGSVTDADFSGLLSVAKGGTGAATLPSGLLVGNGANPPTAVTPGGKGSTLVSTGTAWASQSPISDVYNWKPSNTRRLQRSMAAALGGTGYCDIITPGDSHVSSLTGAVSTSTPVNNFAVMWPRRLRTLLAGRSMPIGGEWIFANDAPGANDDRWTFTGNWVDGYGYRATNQAGSVTAKCTFDLPGTTVAVAYIDVAYAAQFNISVDGGTAVPITPSDGNGKVTIWTKTGLTDTMHNVTISGTAANVFLLAAACYRASGIRICNVAQQGAQLNRDWSASAFGNYTNRAYAVKTILPNPDVQLIDIGLNDYGAAGRTSAQIISDTTYLRNQFPSTDTILFADNQPPGNTYAGWDTHITNLYALADTLDCPLIDLNKAMGGPTVAKANGMYSSDDLHYTWAGEALISLLVADTLMRRGS